MAVAGTPSQPVPIPRSGNDSGSDALLWLKDAGVAFGSHRVLREVTLSIRAGERVALLGSNGSGKTTLLRLLHGQVSHSGHRGLRPNAHGQLPTQSMVFQRPFLLRLSVWRNLLIALWLAGVPRSQRALLAEQALERVRMTEHRDRPARVLSGGQQQRLALARAWAVRPAILFLDEPTASLDPTAKREVEALIGEFAAEGMTVIMSTHNLGQAKRLASRVVYLENGRIVVDRSVRAFFEDPLPEPAALFLSGEQG